MHICESTANTHAHQPIDVRVSLANSECYRTHLGVPLLQELTNMERKRRVLSCLDRLKEALPKFSIAMQNYVKHPSNVTAKVSHLIPGPS